MLALPIVVSLTHGAIQALDYRVSETAKTLGAGLLLRWRLYVSEACIGVSLGILTAFVDFLISESGQKRIRDYMLEGERLFYPLHLSLNAS